MSELKAILFDADGVAITPNESFSLRYARAKNIDPEAIQPFFADDFQQALVGEADLKESIEKHHDTWQLDGSVDELLGQWFSSENNPNTKLVELIKQLRKQGLRCYLATNQEKYRTAYFREVMFPDVFDNIFSSAEIGATKPSEDYFNAVLSKLAIQNISAEQIAFFDDSQKNVDEANILGIQGYLYTDIADVKEVLRGKLRNQQIN